MIAPYQIQINSRAGVLGVDRPAVRSDILTITQNLLGLYFAIVAPSADRLQVAKIKEQFRVALVRFGVVDDS